MKDLPRISVIIGTRPEAIKLAPVIIEFKKCKEIETRVILTGQHKQMVNEIMKLFNIESDKNLDIMRSNQTLGEMTARIINEIQIDFKENKPSMVIVQGDTTSAFTAGLTAFYEKIPVGHVEAGLRTNNLLEPFPEELNRRLLSQLACLHFAPTVKAKQNLVNSGVLGSISITGNTVIDALTIINERLPDLSRLIDINKLGKKRIILSTVHRRENWGDNLKSIALSLKEILDNNPDTFLILPMHVNPLVRDVLTKILGSNSRALLTEPLKYSELLSAMKACEIIITDSGGIQEEAPSFQKPVLILRNSTERQEVIDNNSAILVGTNKENIVKNADILLKDKEVYRKMKEANNPFGDGHASKYILEECIKYIFKKKTY